MLNPLLKALLAFILILIFFIWFLFWGNSVYFGIFTWDRSISKFFNPKLEKISTGTSGNGKEVYTFSEEYFFYNFSNDANDFKLIDSLIQGEQLKPKFPNETFKDGSKTFEYVFLWNNILDSPRRLIFEYSNTAEGKELVGLFSISVKYYSYDYYFERIGEWNKLNNWGKSYKFKKRNGGSIETDADNFDFIFWTQANDYIENKIPDKMGKQIFFYNGDERIVGFDYRSGKGYKLVDAKW